MTPVHGPCHPSTSTTLPAALPAPLPASLPAALPAALLAALPAARHESAGTPRVGTRIRLSADRRRNFKVNVPADDEVGLGRARAKRWWLAGRRVRSVERAAAFIDDVSCALLFPAPRVVLPSLWEAVAGEDDEPFAAGMGVPEQRIWAWKDELPRRGLAWYGRFLAGRASFLSPALLAALYAGAGEVDDHEALPLSPVAHDLARILPGARCSAPSCVPRWAIGPITSGPLAAAQPAGHHRRRAGDPDRLAVRDPGPHLPALPGRWSPRL